MIIDRVEKYGPIAFAVLGGVCSLTLALLAGMSSIPTAMIATTMTFGIVMAGFSATQRNMLFSLRGSRVIRHAIEINQINRVLSYLAVNPFVGLGLTLYSFLGFLTVDEPIAVRVWVTVLGALVFFALACLTRNEIVMYLILKRYMEEKPE